MEASPRTRKASSIAELDYNARAGYNTMIEELKDLDDFSEDEKVMLSKISVKLVDVSRKSFSAVDRDIVKSLGISLPNPAAMGTVDKDARRLTLLKNTVPAEETDLGQAAVTLLDFVDRAWSDRTEMASRTAIDLIIFGAVGALEEKGEKSYHISPEHPISEAKFSKADDPTQQLTVGGRVDYLIASAESVELAGLRTELEKKPEATVRKYSGILRVTLIEAKSTENMKNIFSHIPQAAIEAAAHCTTHQKTSVRGCLASGRQWVFYVYNAITREFLQTECMTVALGNAASVDEIMRYLQYWVLETENPETSFLLTKQ